MQTRTEEITTPSGPMGVHIVRPDGDGPFPVIVFFHHGPGLDDGAKQTMARIAEWGYYVVSHDRYHRAEPWYAMQSRSDDEIKKMFGLVLGTTEDQVAEDLDALLAWLPSDPPPAAAPWAASATASEHGRRCAPSAIMVNDSAPASACTRPSAPPTTAIHPISLCRRTPGRCTSRSARPTRCSPHPPTPHSSTRPTLSPRRGRDPRRRRPRVRRVRPRLPRSRRGAVLRARQGHVRPRAQELTAAV